MNETLLNIAFFGIPATFLLVFTGMMIYEEFFNHTTPKGNHTNEMD